LNLPFVTICRKKFGEYKEYHTSADNLKIMNYKTIIETVKFIKKIITEINKNKIFKKKNYCEPFLTGTKLINNFSTIQNMRDFKRKSISDFLAYVNKNHDLKSLAQTYNIPNINKLALMLKKNKLIKEEI
jgi:aminopeptidase-like protein